MDPYKYYTRYSLLYNSMNYIAQSPKRQKIIRDRLLKAIHRLEKENDKKSK